MTLDRVHTAVHRAFVRATERIISINVQSWTATILIDTSHRGGQVRASELLDLAIGLGIEPSAVAIWDGGSQRCEVTLDLEERTPIDNPRRASTHG